MKYNTWVIFKLFPYDHETKPAASEDHNNPLLVDTTFWWTKLSELLTLFETNLNINFFYRKPYF
jgi:hypothetical protein